jgi:murein DD-endopeptidase MepM/ murein hydrolase activator NlpD
LRKDRLSGDPSKPRLSSGHILLALIPFVLLVAAVVLLHNSPSDHLEASVPPREAELPAAARPGPLEAHVQGQAQNQAPDQAQPAEQNSPATPAQDTVQGLVASGNTADDLLSGHLSPAEIHALAVACANVFPLSKLKSGQPYRIQTEGGVFAGFEYEIDRDRALVVRRYGDRLVPAIAPIEYEVRLSTVSGTIQSSLFDAVAALGETPELALRLADIFAWDIDFCRDIQPGDSFRAVVEKRYRDGKFVCYGKMPVAEFVNEGQAFRGYSFDNGKGGLAYYDGTGRCLRKAFLLAPLSFTRITSGFTHKRLHPILQYYRPHTGVDYAAPVGTPVWSVGEGSVTAVGYNGSAGKFVAVSHAGGLRTQYSHLSGYARGIRTGQHVSQGQTIGYVGMTGLATGPHLDFRLYQGTKPMNPRMLRGSATTEPVPHARMAQFKKTAESLLALLESAPGREPEQQASAEAAPAVN